MTRVAVRALEKPESELRSAPEATWDVAPIFSVKEKRVKRKKKKKEGVEKKAKKKENEKRKLQFPISLLSLLFSFLVFLF